MPFFPGLLAMPTVLLDLALSFVLERGRPVRGPDRVAAVLPMYNEASGASAALRSLLRQSEPPDEVLVSINGGSDPTPEVVRTSLREHGYRAEPGEDLPFESVPGHDPGSARLQRWLPPDTAGPLPPVVVVEYTRPQAKSESINRAVALGLVEAERILVLDGDTVLEPGFVAALRDGFYRLLPAPDAPAGYELQDLAIQTGAVASVAPPGAPWPQRLISAGRNAEYALSCTLREGQARPLGRTALFGRSRLYTVVGCGFVARRDQFPMPIDTPTEDHDFTLASQNRAEWRSTVDAARIRREGWTVRDPDSERPLADLLGPSDTLTVRHSGEAVFVPKARMETEDPATVPALARQLERWNGGGLDNALKRILGRTPLTPAVRYTMWSSLLEDLLGLLLLALLPLALAANLADPARGLPLAGLRTWLMLDAAISWVLISYALAHADRLRGRHPLAAFVRGALRGARLLPPFLLLRTLSPFTFVAAATSVLPARLRHHLGRSDRRVAARPAVRWERPAARAPTRTLGAVLGSGVFAFTSMAVVALVVTPAAVDRGVWRLLQSGREIPMELHDELPYPAAALEVQHTSLQPDPYQPDLSPAVGAATAAGPTASSRQPWVLSSRCPPAERPEPSFGNASDYRPLGRGYLLTLARLAPLLPLAEQGAQRYQVPLPLLLQVLLNESYLDPLAVGSTGDKGLSQMTSDSLKLLGVVSAEPGTILHNPALMAPGFNVFDPDFSICAGAAKLAWALEQPNGGSAANAYALYINPLYGIRQGEPAPALQVPVGAMLQLEQMVLALGAVFAQARVDSDVLTDSERALVAVTQGVAAGELDLTTAYQRAYQVVRGAGLDDTAMYQRVLEQLFGLESGELEPLASRNR